MLFPEPLSIPARTRNQRTWKKPIMYLLFLERLEFYRFLLLFGEQSVRECGTGGLDEINCRQRVLIFYELPS